MKERGWGEEWRGKGDSREGRLSPRVSVNLHLCSSFLVLTLGTYLVADVISGELSDGGRGSPGLRGGRGGDSLSGQGKGREAGWMRELQAAEGGLS